MLFTPKLSPLGEGEWNVQFLISLPYRCYKLKLVKIDWSCSSWEKDVSRQWMPYHRNRNAWQSFWKLRDTCREPYWEINAGTYLTKPKNGWWFMKQWKKEWASSHTPRSNTAAHNEWKCHALMMGNRTKIIIKYR